MRPHQENFHLFLYRAYLLKIPVRLAFKFLDPVLVILKHGILCFLRLLEKADHTCNPNESCSDYSDSTAGSKKYRYDIL